MKRLSSATAALALSARGCGPSGFLEHVGDGAEGGVVNLLDVLGDDVDDPPLAEDDGKAAGLPDNLGVVSEEPEKSGELLGRESVLELDGVDLAVLEPLLDVLDRHVGGIKGRALEDQDLVDDAEGEDPWKRRRSFKASKPFSSGARTEGCSGDRAPWP